MRVVFNYPITPFVGDHLDIVVPAGTETLCVREIDTMYGATELELLVVTDPAEKEAELMRIYRVLHLHSFDEAAGWRFLCVDKEGSTYWVAPKRAPLRIQDIK